MLLKEDTNFWELYKLTGDFFVIDIKVDAGKKFGDFLEGEIIAELKESEDDNFRHGWIVRKTNGQPYLFVFYEQLDYILIITARVDLIQK
ncbi:MAG: hypothetical protein ACTSRG_10200 [Candidatus Helarchaeota archaeon]